MTRDYSRIHISNHCYLSICLITRKALLFLKQLIWRQHFLTFRRIGPKILPFVMVIGIKFEFSI